MAAAIEKREERLKKKELSLDEERAARQNLESEIETLKRDMQRLQTLTHTQSQALAKKEKQLQEQAEALENANHIQEQIFNLSKFKKK